MIRFGLIGHSLLYQGIQRFILAQHEMKKAPVWVFRALHAQSLIMPYPETLILLPPPFTLTNTWTRNMQRKISIGVLIRVSLFQILIYVNS
jgi:hypothetical protein